MKTPVQSPLSALRCFEVASKCQNFSAAADILCLTPSAVSHQIKLLEAYLGHQLFVRSKRHMCLTAAGELYAKRISPAFAEIENATIELQRMGKRSQLLVQVAPSLASIWLVPRFSMFIQKHPEIQISLITNNGQNSPPAHCEIRYGDGNWPNSEVSLLWTETLCPLVAQNGPKLKSVSDLNDAPLIHTRSRIRGWKDLFQNYALEPDTSRSGLFFDRTGLALEVASSGVGVALESPFLARSFIEDRILHVPLEGIGVEDESYYFVTPRGLRSPEVESFRNWVVENLPTPE